ncbi:MAG: DUF2497 domain-containing protein [Pseudolabrys sp.]
MTQTAKAQEPSMEEILASIRHIIADNDAGKPAKPREPAPPNPAPAAIASPPRSLPEPEADSQSGADNAVLADFEAPEPEPQTEPGPAAATKPESDVRDLTEAMTAPASSPNFRTIDGTDDVVFTDRPAEPAQAAPSPPPAMEPPAAPPLPSANPPDSALLSNATAAAVDSAFNALAHTVFGQNARTLEDLVKEMLRPMLKSWLDDNLPGLVERIVRAEIERVSRGKP